MHINTININFCGRQSAMASAFIESLFEEPTATTTAAEPEATEAPILPPKIGSPWPGIGGKYAGISPGEDDTPDGHLILLDDLPGKDLTWGEAVQWAESLGNDARLPTRFESALIYANLRGHVDTERWHWTGTQSSSTGAWSQYFRYGTQDTGTKSYKARARAVRRLIL